MSLSTWLRDYLYVPLGGNRGGVLATQRNLMVTMLLGGLWHGASWNFVIWGGLHGVYLAVNRVWRLRAARPIALVGRTLPYRFAAWLLTMAAVGLAWVFFRCRELDDSLFVVRELLLPREVGASVLDTASLTVIGASLVVAWLADRRALFDRIDRSHWALRGILFATVLFVLAVFAAVDAGVPFLYFRF